MLTQARLQATKSGKKVMAALVVYDLPARDCAALASNGEIPCADAECTAVCFPFPLLVPFISSCSRLYRESLLTRTTTLIRL